MRAKTQLSAIAALLALSASVSGQEVIVLGGIDEGIEWLQSENWWGEENREAQLTVPRLILTGINDSWNETATRLTVPQKKEVFYRLMLPLVLYANSLVADRRAALLALRQTVVAGGSLTTTDLDVVREAAVRFRAADQAAADALQADGDDLIGVIDELLYRLDIIPPGLVLGQAAYESGYGTSRFAVEGNSLFGQWTFNGEGMVPGQQRSDLGDHRIAAFDWPFDSVRGYFINLMSHPAYDEFRRLRAELRTDGRPLDSLLLADGLIKYSERGQEYVDTLKSIMRVNNLTIADDAVFRDEPIRYVVGASDAAEAEQLKAEIEQLRESGELERIVASMRLQ